MRCRQGDMAIVLYGKYSGYLVTVVRFVGRSDYGCENSWEVHPENVPVPTIGCYWVAEDKGLLPIRPGDLQEKEEMEKKLEISAR